MNKLSKNVASTVLIFLCASLAGCVSKQALIETLAPSEKVRRFAIDESLIMSYQTSEFLKTNTDEKATQEVIEAVKLKLKDPGSAQFMNIQRTPYKDGVVYCGYVNAKNSYGGYVGYRKFVASPYAAAIQNDALPHQFEYAYNGGVIEACNAR